MISPYRTEHPQGTQDIPHMHHDIPHCTQDNPQRHRTHVIQGDHSNFLIRFSPIKMISYTLIYKMVAKSLLHRLWPFDNENVLNQLLSGRYVLILRFSSPFHILIVFLQFYGCKKSASCCVIIDIIALCSS